jgi:hypothetical protein
MMGREHLTLLIEAPSPLSLSFIVSSGTRTPQTSSPCPTRTNYLIAHSKRSHTHGRYGKVAIGSASHRLLVRPKTIWLDLGPAQNPSLSFAHPAPLMPLELIFDIDSPGPHAPVAIERLRPKRSPFPRTFCPAILSEPEPGRIAPQLQDGCICCRIDLILT